MERDRYQRIKRLVLAADALPAEGRAAFLDAACEGDTALRTEVERMLRPATLQTRQVDVHAALGAPDGATGEVRVAPAPGERIGPFEILEELGRGGMGVVCAARDTRDGAEVALKLVHPHLLDRPQLRERFAREARLGKRVEHENVVRTFETLQWESDGVTHDVLVMERVRGRCLREVLTEWGRVPEPLVREIARQVAAGLVAVHSAGIVHRDMKPENVMLTDDQRVRIMDLGIAKVQETALELTLEGHFVGSLAYASPEQFEQGEIGPACDLYALGVVLYELLTGVNPFRRDALAASVAAHLGDRPPPVALRETDVSRFLSNVVETLIERNAEQRFASAQALLDVLTDGESGPWWTEREAATPGRRQSPTPAVDHDTSLHGRADDLAALHAAALASREGAGRLLLVEGEPGIGKTRLLDAFLQECADTDVHAVYGSFGAPGGLRGLTDAIEGALGSGAVADAVAEMLGPDAGHEHVALLRREPDAVDAVPLGEGALTALCCRALRRLAAERPVVWMIDDLHHASPAARKAILAMARTAESLPVLLIATTRDPLPADELAQLQRLSGFARRTLARLAAKEVFQLLEEALGSETLAERVGARIAKRSDGVPFFVFEMIRALRDDGSLTRSDDGGYVLSRSITEVEVPAAIRDLVATRLGELTREERETLDVAAVVGAEFDAAVVAQVLGRPVVRVLQDLAELQRRRGLIRSSGRGHRFDHQQTREVLYGELPDALRAEYHALVADALAADAPDSPDPRTGVALAQHHLRGSRPGAGLKYLRRALEHLVACHRSDEAADLAELALSQGTLLDSRQQIELHLHAANDHDVLGRRDAQLAHAQEALVLAEHLGEDAWIAQAHQALGIHAFTQHDTHEATTQLRSALEHARAAGEESLVLDTQIQLANALSMTRSLDEARVEVEEAVALAAARGDATREGEALRVLAGMFVHEYKYAEALEVVERARDLLEAAGDQRAAASAHSLRGSLCWFLGRVDEARAGFQRCLEIAQQTGDRRLEVNARGRLGLASLHAGRLDEALRHFRHHREGGVEIGDAAAVGQALANLAQTRALLGDFERSVEHATRAAEVGAVIDGRRLQAFAGTQAATSLRLMGRLEEARQRADEALSVAREVGDVMQQSQAMTELAAIAEAANDKALAVVLLRDVEKMARDAESQSLTDAALLHLARLGAAEAGDAWERYEKNESVLAVHQRLQARHSAWQTNGDPENLAIAHELLLHLSAHAPPERSRSMLEDVRAYREIVDAFEATG